VSHDETEFAEFFQASWDPCLRAVGAGTGNVLLAEDQVAEAFARAYPDRGIHDRRQPRRHGHADH
jgi:hypothetical protein